MKQREIRVVLSVQQYGGAVLQDWIPWGEPTTLGEFDTVREAVSYNNRALDVLKGENVEPEKTEAKKETPQKEKPVEAGDIVKNCPTVCAHCSSPVVLPDPEIPVEVLEGPGIAKRTMVCNKCKCVFQRIYGIKFVHSRIIEPPSEKPRYAVDTKTGEVKEKGPDPVEKVVERPEPVTDQIDVTAF